MVWLVYQFVFSSTVLKNIYIIPFELKLCLVHNLIKASLSLMHILVSVLLFSASVCVFHDF